MTAAITPTDAEPRPGAGFTGHDLCCRRGGRLVFEALDFALGPGDALMLVGPNGSGKSSLLRLMAGLLPPFLGELRWRGAPVPADPDAHRARLAYLGHLDAVKPSLSVAENLAFWIALGGGAAESGAAALARFGLDELASLPARYLSAGQRRRLALARVAALPKSLWLLDEPSTGLDTRSVAALEAAIEAHRRGGGIVVLSTHAPLDLPGAERLDLSAYAS